MTRWWLLLLLAISLYIMYSNKTSREFYKYFYNPKSDRVLIKNSLPLISSSEQQLIPKRIIQTAESNLIDMDLYHTCNQNKYMNPDYEYLFFDKEARLSFIKEYFPQYLDDYNNILPGAYKADLFRYLALYQLGGVYIDCKSSVVAPLREFISPEDQVVLVRDLNDDYIYNGLIASIPGSTIIKAFIDTYVQNIRKKYYGKNVFDIGGPSMCGTVFKNLIHNSKPIQLGEYLIDSVKVKVSSRVDFSSSTSVIRRSDNKVLFIRSSNKYLLRKLKNILLVKDYSSMWFFGKVYKK